MPKKKSQNRRADSSDGNNRNESVSRLYLAALDAVEHAIHVVDRDLTIHVFNRSFKNWCRELGIDRSDFVGEDIFEAFPFLGQDVRDQYEQVFATGESLVTSEDVTVDDRVISTRTEKIPITHDGDVTHVVTIVADVTDIKTAKEELRTQNEQHSLVLDSVPVAIAIIGKDGEFIYINSHGARDFGYPPEEVIGRTHFDFFPDDLADRHIKRINEVIDSGQAFHDIVRTRTGNRWGWYDINIQPYEDARTKSPAALLIANDITSYKNAIDALRESEDRFRLLFESVPLPTYIWQYRENEFVLTGYNTAAKKITHGKIDEYIGKTATDMYRNMPDVKRDLERCLSNRETIRKEMPYTFMSTGEDRFLVVYYVFVPPDTVLVHTEDITDRYRARQELEKAHDQLEQRVVERTRELAAANETLEVEREALHQKNIVLNQVLDQIEQGKRELGSQIQTNINRIALPILKSLESYVDSAGLQLIEFLKTNLNEITSPLAIRLEERFRSLTPREVEICHMVKNGLTCKEIAATFNTSLQTVLKQRSIIRKKIGIAGKKVNLASFLKSLR